MCFMHLCFLIITDVAIVSGVRFDSLFDLNQNYCLCLLYFCTCKEFASVLWYNQKAQHKSNPQSKMKLQLPQKTGDRNV